MRIMSGRGRHPKRTPTVVIMRRLVDVGYGISLLGICGVIVCAERMIGTHGGAAKLALVLLASGGVGQLARWLDNECRRHER